MDDYGNTPLHWAAGKNQVESVKFLLRKGANPNLRNCSMMAPLHVAVQGGYNDVMKVSLLAVPRPSNIAWAGPQVQLCLLCPKGQPRLPGPTTCDDFKVGFSIIHQIYRFNYATLRQALNTSPVGIHCQFLGEWKDYN